MPAADVLEAFYQSPEASTHQYDFPERSIRKHARRLYRWMAQVKPNGSLLDVGCGLGVHLEVAREFGWRPLGLDWSATARERCRARGVAALHPADVLQRPEQYKEAFDAVTGWEVLEHQTDPESFVRQLSLLTRHDGILAFSTPNFNSVRARADYGAWYELRPPMHLQFFTPLSFRLLLERCELTVLNQLTYVSSSDRVERVVSRAGRALRLSDRTVFLLKVACYKLVKPYFDRTLHRGLQGLGLLTMASPSPRRPTLRLRKRF